MSKHKEESILKGLQNFPSQNAKCRKKNTIILRFMSVTDLSAANVTRLRRDLSHLMYVYT